MMIFEKVEKRDTFDKILYDKLVEVSHEWKRERADNEIPLKQLVFCWDRYKASTPEDLFAKPGVVIGTLVHRGLEHYFGWEDKPDSVIKKEIYDPETDQTWVIVGMPDLIIDDTVYEFKYSSSYPKQPKPWDLEQLKLYLWLTGKTRGELVYLTPVRIKSFVVTEPATDAQVLGLIKRPYWKWNWECVNCPLRHNCPYRRV